MPAKSFQNPDSIETTIHCYRYWYGNAKGDPALQQYEEQLWRSPKFMPTIALAGDSNPQRHHLFTRPRSICTHSPPRRE